MFYGTGLRLEEMCHLKMSCIDSNNAAVKVEKGKGNKDRMTVLPKTLLADLYAYHKICRPQVYLFEGRMPGKPMSNGAIRESGYKQWKVYAKAPFGGPDQVPKYLGRYTHKTAITSYRIEAVKNGTVRFSYKDYADGNKIKRMGLNEKEFLRRFEQHNLFRKSGSCPNALYASAIMGS